MSALELLTFSSEIIFWFASLLTDSGIQIWNSIEVDEIATPLCCQTEEDEPSFTRKKREGSCLVARALDKILKLNYCYVLLI